MSSTFKELFQDFQDKAKLYTEKLEVTELYFMRLLTKGMQEFQRDTHYVEAALQIVPRENGWYYVPEDLLMVKVLRQVDRPHLIYLFQEYEQFQRNYDLWSGGMLETPTDYAMRIPPSGFVGQAVPPKRTAMLDDGQPYIVTIWNRRLIVYPNDNVSANGYHLSYIPNLHAFSESSMQWTKDTSIGDPLKLDSNGNELTMSWFPMDEIISDHGIAKTRFLHHFNFFGLSPSLALYENAFVNFALAEYIMSKGNPNYAVYERKFETDKMRAIETKPTLFREGVADYMFAPWS